MSKQANRRRSGGVFWKLIVLIVGIGILTACSGTSTTESTVSAGEAVSTATRTAQAIPADASPTPDVLTGAPPQPSATPDAMASAPPLPTQGIPMQPSPVASELPLGTPAGTTLSLPPTPTCATLALTPADTEGPYFLDNTPERTSFIEPGMSGTKLVITGYVVTRDCRPVDGAQVEFWQAGPDGEYDLQGYRFRGHLFTDANGYYRLETLLPAVYGGRPRHIHVKVLPPGSAGLTTQLYFPDDSPVAELTVAYDESVEGALAVFNFVLP